MNLLTAHPDQPYGQPAIKHPFDGYDIVKPKDTMPPGAIMPKDQMVLKIAEKKSRPAEGAHLYKLDPSGYSKAAPEACDRARLERHDPGGKSETGGPGGLGAGSP